MRRRFAAFGLLLFAAVPAWATPVTGHVTNAQTSAPITGATISYFNIPFGPFGGTTTDSDGYYSVDIPQGLTNFSVNADGFVSYGHDVEINATPLVIDVPLTESSSVSGTVRDGSTLQPLSGERIVLIDAGNPSLPPRLATSDDNGLYQFDGIAPGAYGICVQQATDNYRDACYDGMTVQADGVLHYTEIDLVPGSTVGGIDISLAPGATLSGKFTDRYFGTPVANQEMEILLYSASQQLVADFTLTTAADGGYSIGGLAPGDYFLEAGKAFIVTNVDTAYTRHLYGGADCGAGPNDYSDCSFADVAPITVPIAGVDGIDLALFPGYVITGRVVDAATGAGLANVPVRSCEFFGIGTVSGSAVTDANGYYTVAHAVNEHTSLIANPGPPYLEELWPNLALSADSCVIPMQPNQIHFTLPNQVLTGINFSIPQASAVNGTVLSGEDPPEPLSASVEVLSYPNGNLLATGHSDASGAFQILGNFPGPIAIVAYLDGGQDCQVYYWNFCGFGWTLANPVNADLSTATTFTLGVGESAGPLVFYLGDDVFSSNFE